MTNLEPTAGEIERVTTAINAEGMFPIETYCDRTARAAILAVDRHASPAGAAITYLEERATLWREQRREKEAEWCETYAEEIRALYDSPPAPVVAVREDVEDLLERLDGGVRISGEEETDDGVIERVDVDDADDAMAEAAEWIRAHLTAAEIARLRAEVARLDEALEPFANSCIDVSGTAAIGVSQRDIDRARAARMPAEGRAALEQEGG